MTNKPRNKWIAAFLTLLTMGLGHIYCGEVRKGSAFLIIHYIILLIAYFLLENNPSLTSLAVVALSLLLFFLYCLVDTLKISRKKSKYYTMQKFNKWYVYVAVIMIFVFFPRPLTRSYIKENIAKTFNILAESMVPTLLIGDMILATTNNESKSNIKKGELILFNYPKNPSRIFIKRVIATEGETLSIKNKRVLINNKEINEPYIINTDTTVFPQQFLLRDNMETITIPAGSLFVMGDNRDHSYDSRFWGFVKESDIIGKAAFLFWSWDSGNKEIRWNRIGKILK